MAMAGSCVVGSMTRSGRITTQAQAMTSTRRARAARPGHPASSRSSHPAGLSPLPKDSSRTAALRATTYSNVPASVSSHTERRKRTARMYSGPSGQAAMISASDPKSTARPSVDSTRPSHVAPSDTSEASSTTTSSSSSSASTAAGAVVGVVAPGTVVASGSTAVEVSTVKVKRSLAGVSLAGRLTCHATLHSPTGVGSFTVTVSVSRSSLSSGRLTSTGSPSQASCTWLASPSSVSKVRTISDGGSASSSPSAGLLSTSATCCAAAVPTISSAPATAAGTARTRRSVRPGTPVRAGTTGTR